ncbi:hypothetical protein HD597_012900 [Nonomuraea thailandensis]|uniref:Uncharacterized protein n=1 Tax=Nonomuraea thailandensis TaxID=1188745 RepID=A0A9X2GVD0_9ACTN|nr:hypothetical protein [Nonomuraea thailandensis]MCP2365796.1 hypothetical protein [Nonomuraea thailandensis]
MTTITRPHPARADQAASIARQIRAYLDRILAADTSESAAALLQVDQARMLKTMHGGDVVAWVYAAWLRDYHRAALPGVEPLTAWDDLCLAMAPIPRWNRDIHGFLCVGGCDDCFAQVAESDGFGWCGPCARRLLEAEPSQVRPLPFPAAHHHLVHRGLLPEERAHFRAAELHARLTDDTTVTYIAGDATAFDHPAWMGMSLTSIQLSGDPDRPALHLTAHTGQHGHRFSIHATLAYDPTPDTSRPHGYPIDAYGFRLATAELTDTNGHTTTVADLHELLDVIVCGETEAAADDDAPSAAPAPTIAHTNGETMPSPGTPLSTSAPTQDAGEAFDHDGDHGHDIDDQQPPATTNPMGTVPGSVRAGYGVECVEGCWITSFFIKPGSLPNVPTFRSLQEAVEELPGYGWTRAHDVEGGLGEAHEVPAAAQLWRCPDCTRRRACELEEHLPVRKLPQLTAWGTWRGGGLACRRCRCWLTQPAYHQASRLTRTIACVVFWRWRLRCRRAGRRAEQHHQPAPPPSDMF